MPKAVIFDIDGTLIDTVPLHAEAWAETFRRYGLDVPVDDIRAQIGKGGDQLMPVFLSPEMIEEHGEEMEEFRANLFKDKYFPQARGLPGVRELFERLRSEGQRIVLASSCKGEELERHTKLAGIPDLIDSATTSDDAERSKPYPDIFQAALARLDGIDPADAVVVGDIPYDAEAARESGVKTV